MYDKLFRSLCIMIAMTAISTAAYGQFSAEEQEARSFVFTYETKIDQGDLPTRQARLSQLAPTAYIAGDKEKAQDLANKLLALGEENRGSHVRSFQGGAERSVHVASVVLGLISIDRGDVSGAKDHLAKAGDLKLGDPALRTFGPDMLLAKRLLEKGESGAVLDYLKACSAFWDLGGENLSRWSNEIKAGKAPDMK